MLFFADKNIRMMKKTLADAGADMKAVKPWLRTYSKTHKKAIACTSDYYSQKDRLEKFLGKLRELEAMIIGYEKLQGTKKDRFSAIIKDFKKEQGSINHEFLIGKEDRDFHSTLASIIRIAPAYIRDNKDAVILQSEIENLIEMTKEGLGRRRPELFALSYFYLNHSDKDLDELNFDQKVEKVTAVYEDEFLKPIKEQLPNADDFIEKVCRV